MRVLHWFPNFRAGGGIANSVLALANAQAKAGADVVIASMSNGDPMYGQLTLGDGVALATWDGGRYVGRGRMRLHLVGRARTALMALDPEVVHAHGEFNPDNWWAPRLWQRPLVLTPHGAYHPTVLGRVPRQKQMYIATAKRLLYRHVTAFHALNPAEQRDISSELSDARTYYVPQGPSPAVEQAMPALDAPSRAPGPIRFMFIGRIDVRTKGLDVLVEAFAGALRRCHTPASLTLVGPDWNNGALPLRRLAQRLGAGDLVDIRGRVTDVEVPRLLESCDVYVQLSRNEGSPLSLNDALVFGRPTIVSDHVGTVSCEEIALMPHVKIVPPRVPEATEAIVGAIDRFDEIDRAARSSHAQLRDFLSWERAARLHIAEYTSLSAGDQKL